MQKRRTTRTHRTGRRAPDRPRASRSAALVVAVVTAAGLFQPAASAAPDATVNASPGVLEPGRPTTVPYVAGRTFVTPHHRVTRPGPMLHLGRSVRGHLLWETGRVVRVGPHGGVSEVLRGPGNYYVLGRGGHTLYEHRTRRDGRAVVLARSARDGEVLARRAFRRSTGILTGTDGRVLLTEADRGTTRWWAWRSDGIVPVSEHTSYKADLASGRLALSVPDEDGDGACTSVVDLSSADELWRSCTESVHAFSPDGHRMLTTRGWPSDEGPAVLRLRNSRGEVLATYRSGWFGRVLWEGGGRPVIQTSRNGRTTLARCTPTGCRRAAPLWRTLLFP